MVRKIDVNETKRINYRDQNWNGNLGMDGND